MMETPEYSVGCRYTNGRHTGRSFDLESSARAYYVECVASGRYGTYRLFHRWIVANYLSR